MITLSFSVHVKLSIVSYCISKEQITQTRKATFTLINDQWYTAVNMSTAEFSRPTIIIVIIFNAQTKI